MSGSASCPVAGGRATCDIRRNDAVPHRSQSPSPPTDAQGILPAPTRRDAANGGGDRVSSGGTRLLAIEVENFKSYRERRRLNLAPLTVLIGRNNSGKSALIQPLLLLKQALAIARPELVLNLTGELINARNVRDLTHGWPGPGTAVPGPAFAIE